MAQSRPFGFTYGGEFSQRRCARHALDANGEESAERSDDEDVPLRLQSTAMKEKPQQPTGHDRNSGSAHLWPEESICLIATHLS